MRRTIISLVLDAIVLICWSIVGIIRAATNPSWLCLLDGFIITAYVFMTIDNTRCLIKTTKEEKNEKNQTLTHKE